MYPKLHAAVAGKASKFVAFIAICIVSCVASAAEFRITRVSVDSDERQSNQVSTDASISADGRFVVFNSNASNLVGNDTDFNIDVFVRDRIDTKTLRIGRACNYLLSRNVISADGRFVAFASADNSLVPGDTNNTCDVFVKDLETGVIERVSVSSAGAQGNNMSVFPSISCDGRIVAFYSWATNLVAGDSNGMIDVFVRDRTANVTTRVSVHNSGAQGNYNSAYPSISCDGRFVAFLSYASNLVTGDTNVDIDGEPISDIFVHDRMSGTTTRVSVDSAGAQSNGKSCCASISGDGRFVGFASMASNLVAGDTNNAEDVFVHDRQTGATTRVSTSSAGVQGNSYSGGLSLNHDGRYVAYSSWATNLVAGDTDNGIDVFLHNRQIGSVQKIGGNRWSYSPSISADGNVIAFTSSSTNLITGDTNNVHDIFTASRVRKPPFTYEQLKQFEWTFIDAERVRCMIMPPCPLPPGLGPDPLPWRFQADAGSWQWQNFAVQLHDLYRAALPLLRGPGKLENPGDVTRGIAAAMRKVPLGIHYNRSLQNSLLRKLEGLNDSTSITAIQAGLLQALNAVELDARTGVFAKSQVAAAKTASVNLPRLVSFKFKNIARAGTLSVTTNNQLPAWADGMAPSWPVLSYSLDFSGQLAKGGEVDIEFYVGDVAFSPLSLRRVFEWDGKAYKDVTVSVDRKRGVITGRTRKLTSYVIM